MDPRVRKYVTGGWKMLRSVDVYDLHSLPVIYKMFESRSVG
jgi:hypothetical protein